MVPWAHPLGNGAEAWETLVWVAGPLANSWSVCTWIIGSFVYRFRIPVAGRLLVLESGSLLCSEANPKSVGLRCMKYFTTYRIL